MVRAPVKVKAYVEKDQPRDQTRNRRNQESLHEKFSGALPNVGKRRLSGVDQPENGVTPAHGNRTGGEVKRVNSQEVDVVARFQESGAPKDPPRWDEGDRKSTRLNSSH